MAASDPIAGSSRTYFPPPFRIDGYGSVTPKVASRSSTPARPISRARSLSTFSSRSNYDEDEIRLQRKRADSVKRMVSSWDLLLDKYPAISLHEDDVVDLRTGSIIEDRGRIRRMQETRLGSDEGEGYQSHEDEDEAEEFEIGSDEDELGLWDERSGLDPQTRQKPPEMPRSEQDMEDIDEFLRLEAEQRKLQAKRNVVRDWSSDSGNSSDAASSSQSSSTDEASGEDSEDELNEDDAEASSKTPAPSVLADRVSPVALIRTPSSSIEPVPVLQPRIRPEARSKPIPARGSQSAPNLRDLFTPPKVSPSRAMPTTLPSSPPASRRKQIQPSLHRQTSTLRQLRRESTPVDDMFSPSPVSPTLILHAQQPNARSASSSRPATQSAPVSHAPLRSLSPVSLPPHTLRAASHMPVSRPVDAPPKSFTRKGKDRMTGERPLETPAGATFGSVTDAVDPPSDGERYYQVIHRLNSLTVRFCRTCRKSTDRQRQSRAVFCKGRTNGQNCTFARELGEEVVVVRDRNSALKERRRSMSRALTAGLADEDYPAEGSRVGQAVSAGQRAATPNHVGRPRRASAAHMLRVESGATAEDGHSSTTNAILQSIRQKRLQRASVRRSPPGGTVQPGSPTLLPAPPTDLVTGDTRTTGDRPGAIDALNLRARSTTADIDDSLSASRYARAGSAVRSPRVCPICRLAGGERSEAANQCRGRFWTKHCPFNRANSARLSATPGPDPSALISNAKRKRVATPLSASPVHGTALADDRAPQSLATRLSLPPSSPPSFDASTTYALPTPSPTVSAEPLKQIVRPLLPSPLSRRILPLPRGAHYALQPTPPPSSDGTRTPSILGDRFDRPRSILRTAPSSRGTSSAPSSLKRARFSLQPSSPPISDSYDTFQPTVDDEDVDSSSPWRGHRADSRSSDATDSSPFSKELSVRAKDAGFKLGPGHTGRLPAGLINALFPKFSGSIPRVSPAEADRTGIRDARVTPPNFAPASASGRPSFSRPSPSAARIPSTNNASTAGLMLPPPVPLDRGSTASTPGPKTPTRSPSLSPVAPVRRRRSTIVFKTVEPHRTARQPSVPQSAPPALAAGSRSRSIPLTPMQACRAASPLLSSQGEATFPIMRNAQRSSSERKLARLGRDLGDEAGLEWGMDEDVDEDIARRGREGTVFMYVS